MRALPEQEGDNYRAETGRSRVKGIRGLPRRLQNSEKFEKTAIVPRRGK